MAKITLHQAMIQVLSELPNQSGSFQQVADLINKKKLYQRKDGYPLPAYQVKMRAFLAGGRYSHMFSKVGSEGLKLVSPK